jgi:subtilase family serine protease
VRLLGPFLIFPALAFPQAVQVPSRIADAVDETRLTVLRNNTHPLARPEFDLGPAHADLPMDRMLLVLKRSPEREAALRQLLEAQQDKSSPNFHKWLTPEEFGQEFGPSDQDVRAAMDWLESHGFQVNYVAKGRSVIEFSGTASQVQEAFHTTIHKYLVNGKEHWANANDPQIPAALAPVVAGVATLHNFYKKPQLVLSGHQLIAHPIPGQRPAVTFANGQHALGPADYATIYNINPLYTSGINGGGTTIAVVGRSNFNLQDIRDFRNVFGLSINNPQVVLNGPDPGDLGGGEEVEALLDASWSGAVAPNASVKFVASASTNTTDGVDLSELFIIDHNLGNVMSESFSGCEGNATATDAANIATLAEQAAAQGITYVVSSGDSGAEGCDDPNTTSPATDPVSVNILASTPFTVAVGGTEFNENGANNLYWNSNANPVLGSALSYIPENVWNESCASAQCGARANLFASGGGVSKFFPKPSWQTGVANIPNDGARDLPDVSLAAAAAHDPYLLCVQGSCSGGNNGAVSFVSVGGTSAGAPSFAGIMALVNQKTGSRQGQANYVLYRLAAAETLAKCNGSSQAGLPSMNCIFNDVTVGNNAVPGEPGFGTSTGKYQSGAGYDLATGLGSVNATNLVNNWGTARSSASTIALTLSPTTNILQGAPVKVSITVAPKSGAGTPTGDVSLIADFGAGSQQGIGSFTLGAGSVSGKTSLLPGGNYNVSAHYEGDGTFLPSDSTPVAVSVINAGSDFRLSAQPTITIPHPGTLVAATLTVTGVNGFNGTVNFSPASCTGLPADSICAFTPASVTGSGITSLTILTTAPSVTLPKTYNPPGSLDLWRTVGGSVLACLVLIILLQRGTPKRQRYRYAAVAVLSLACFTAIAGCNGGGSRTNPGTPPGTYTVTVTANAGQLAHIIQFKVIVQ